MSPILVAYFSATGTTARVAHLLAASIGADIFAIKPLEPYTAADLNWHDSRSRTTLEMKDDNCRPGIADTIADINKYNVIFIGFPIWWHKAPAIISTFLEQYDFSNKILVPFATSGGSPLGCTEQILQRVCPSAKWEHGKLVSAMATEDELRAWANSLDISTSAEA